MTIPLLVLAFLSLVGGFFNMGIAHFTPFEKFLGTVARLARRGPRPAPILTDHDRIRLASRFCPACGWRRSCTREAAISTARTGELLTPEEKQKNWFWRQFTNKWGVDEFYQDAGC